MRKLALLLMIFASVFACRSADTMSAADSLAFAQAARESSTLYAYPYSSTRRCENWTRVWENTAVLFGAGFATLGILEVLPENTTAWNKSERKQVPFFKRWWNHVKVGPVWDSDLPLFNYILHPYAGGAYYMSARSQGFNVLGSFIYCTAISTCFWEYGIEAFNEVPSIQDLIITPIGGMVVGEAFYLAKRHIVSHDYRLLGSRVLGNIAVVLVDPVNEVLGFIFGNSARKWAKTKAALERRSGHVSSWLGPAPGMLFGLSVSARF